MASYLRRQTGFVQRLWAANTFASKPGHAGGALQVRYNGNSTVGLLLLTIDRNFMNLLFRIVIMQSYTQQLTSGQRQFHVSPQWQKVISFNLSDIGEGIREVTVKEW